MVSDAIAFRLSFFSNDNGGGNEDNIVEIRHRIRGERGDVVNKIDKTVWVETRYIAVWTLLLSMLMQAVFLILDRWNYTVLLGNLLGSGVMLINFFWLALSVQRALEKDEKEAKNTMKLSRSYRYLLLLVAVVVGALAPCFDIWATVIPLLFTRIALLFRPMLDKKDGQA